MALTSSRATRGHVGTLITIILIGLSMYFQMIPNKKTRGNNVIKYALAVYEAKSANIFK